MERPVFPPRNRRSAGAVRAGGRPAGFTAGARAWRTDDLTPLSELCARSYASSTDVRAFAPNGTCEEWMDYVTHRSSAAPGAGASCRNRALSSPARWTASSTPPSSPPTLVAARRTSRSSSSIPARVGADSGASWSTPSCSRPRRHEHARVTLLVAESNRAAGRLYDAAGFSDRAQHIVALRRPGSQPRRSNNVAEATGGASTRR